MYGVERPPPRGDAVHPGHRLFVRHAGGHGPQKQHHQIAQALFQGILLRAHHPRADLAHLYPELDAREQQAVFPPGETYILSSGKMSSASPARCSSRVMLRS